MTGVALIKSAVTIIVADGWVPGLAVIDPSITNLMAAVVGGVVTVVMGWFAFKTTLASLKEKVDKIEGHVNSEKTAAEGREAALRKENALLREIMADKKETAALLAQAVATQPVAVVLPVSAAPAAPAPARTTELAVLKKTEQNTAATAESAAQTADNTAKTEANTAKTEAVVQELKDKP